MILSRLGPVQRRSIDQIVRVLAADSTSAVLSGAGHLAAHLAHSSDEDSGTFCAGRSATVVRQVLGEKMIGASVSRLWPSGILGFSAAYNRSM